MDFAGFKEIKCITKRQDGVLRMICTLLFTIVIFIEGTIKGIIGRIPASEVLKLLKLCY